MWPVAVQYGADPAVVGVLSTIVFAGAELVATDVEVDEETDADDDVVMDVVSVFPIVFLARSVIATVSFMFDDDPAGVI